MSANHVGTNQVDAKHLSDDVLIDALYGIVERGAEEHVIACAVCRARWNSLQEKRGAILTPLSATAATLAEQRRDIFRKIEHPTLTERALGNSSWRWAAPAVACTAAFVLVIGLFVHNPATPRGAANVTSAEQANPAAGDAQVFNEIYAMEQTFEPSASASLGVLFEQPEGSATSESLSNQ